MTERILTPLTQIACVGGIAAGVTATVALGIVIGREPENPRSIALAVVAVGSGLTTTALSGLMIASPTVEQARNFLDSFRSKDR